MTSAERDAIRAQLIRHEGLRLFPYTDTVGKVTIGVGRNLADRGITDAEARHLLDNDINLCLRDLSDFPWFVRLDAVRQRVFVDLAFNLGITRLRTFVKLLEAATRGDWETAAAELLDSAYAGQVGQRAITLAQMLETGTA